MSWPNLPRGMLSGATPFWTSPMDPRFSYCLYVPQSVAPTSPLLVHIHGSGRTPEQFRDRMASFAESKGVVILCPLFPCGVDAPDDVGSYKRVFLTHLRYDLILLDMVADAQRRLGLDEAKFALAGFSGGGQFVQRFILAHAAKLRAASIGAPGLVTLMDTDQPWWCGLKGFEARTGTQLDQKGLSELAIQVLVGEQDVNPKGITSRPGSPLYIEGINDTGATRVARAETLVNSMRGAGLTVMHELVPGVAHNGFEMIDPMLTFLEPYLEDTQ